MRAKWIFLLSLLFLLVGFGLQMLTSWHVSRQKAERAKLAADLHVAAARQAGAAEERRTYAIAREVADRINAQLSWQPETTQLLRWFAEESARAGVRLNSSKIIPPDRNAGAVTIGTYNRVRVALAAEGTYAALVAYIDAIERSNTPMLIESIAINADRQSGGLGKMNLIVSCLTPAAVKDKPAASVAATSAPNRKMP